MLTNTEIGKSLRALEISDIRSGTREQNHGTEVGRAGSDCVALQRRFVRYPVASRPQAGAQPHPLSRLSAPTLRRSAHATCWSRLAVPMKTFMTVNWGRS